MRLSLGAGRVMRARTHDGGAMRGAGCRHAVRSRRGGRRRRPRCRGLRRPLRGRRHRPSPGWVLALIALVAAIPVVLGLVLARRRPDLTVGALLAAFSTVPLAEFAMHAWGATGTTAYPWPGAHVAAVMDVGGWMWFFLPPAVLAAVFPGGRRLTRRGRWLLFGWPVVLAAFGFGVALDPSTYREGGGTVPGRAPASAPEAVGTAVGLLALAGFAALLIGSAAVILVHYRNGESRLRRQIRWLALSAFLLPLVLLVAVGLSLRLAQRQMAPGAAYVMLGDAVTALQEAVTELRRISQGVRPRGLDDGLPAALRARASCRGGAGRSSPTSACPR